MLVQITHMYAHTRTHTYAALYVFAYTRVVRGSGNWQHSNPISHACNHHDHYERKCRKSRRFLTATERPATSQQPPANSQQRPPTDWETDAFFVSGKLASCSNRIRTVHSLGGGTATMGIKRRTKLCGMQKVATPPTPQRQLKAAKGSWRRLKAAEGRGAQQRHFMSPATTANDFNCISRRTFCLTTKAAAPTSVAISVSVSVAVAVAVAVS